MLNNTAKLSDIITELQNLEGINQKADLKSVLVAKGISVSDTDSMADLISKVNSSMYGSAIKNIQRGISTATSTATYVPINSVDLNNSIVYATVKTNTEPVTLTAFTVETTFYSSTSLLLRSSSTTTNVTVYWTVVEYKNIKSMQTGRANFNSIKTLTVSINSINTAKSKFFFSCQYLDGYDQGALRCIIAGDITSQTTINFSSYANISAYITWFVVEFN